MIQDLIETRGTVFTKEWNWIGVGFRSLDEARGVWSRGDGDVRKRDSPYKRQLCWALGTYHALLLGDELS